MFTGLITMGTATVSTNTPAQVNNAAKIALHGSEPTAAANARRRTPA